MNTSRTAALIWTLISTSVLLLSGCGGGGAADPTPAPNVPPASQKATVTVLLTDAPSDAFDHIYVTITSIQLLGDDQPQTLFEGNETVDLLQLENFSDLFAVSDDVDAGTYNKIRLRVSDLELVRLDDDGNVVESIRPNLPANGKIDLNPRGSFTISAGTNVMLQLDMDARRSIHIVGTGNGRYRFRPVVFVDVLVDGLDGKNVRINGEIQSTDVVARTIEVCQRQPSSATVVDDQAADRSPLCVIVSIGDETGIFDSDGNPAPFTSLITGDSVVVIGRFAMDDIGDDYARLIAQVVTIGGPGTFDRLEGTVLTALDANNRFDLSIAPGQGFASGSVLAVNMQSGTGLVDEDGNAVGLEQIVPDIDALVEGVVVLSNDAPDSLRAAYVVLGLVVGDGSGDGDEIMLSGEVLTVDVGASSLMLATDSGDRCVTVTAQTQFFAITLDTGASLSESIGFDDVMPADQADVYGTQNVDGCIDASVIIVSAGT